jgi:oligopeptide/dipeptide ABC transporter ATP-binding protein
MRVSILDLMLSLQKERNLAYLFISHDFGVVRYFSRGGRIMVMFYGLVVEEGPSEQVIRHPRHPYTYLLLQAIPVPDPSLAGKRKDTDVATQAEGEPAAHGCVFANRCPFVEETCRKSRPPLVEQASGQRVACFFPERVPDPEVFVRQEKSA